MCLVIKLYLICVCYFFKRFIFMCIGICVQPEYSLVYHVHAWSPETFIHVQVFCVHVYLHFVCMGGALQKPDEDVISPKTRVTDACKLPRGSQMWSPSLEEQPMLLTSKPSSKPFYLILKAIFQLSKIFLNSLMLSKGLSPTFLAQLINQFKTLSLLIHIFHVFLVVHFDLQCLGMFLLLQMKGEISIRNATKHMERTGEPGCGGINWSKG